MLRIAFSTLAARKGGMFGAFAAVASQSCSWSPAASCWSPACGHRSRSSGSHAAGVVVQADPTLRRQGGTSASSSPSGGGCRPASRRSSASLPGVRAAVADRSFSAAGHRRARAPPHGTDGAPPSATAGRAPRSRRSRSRADARRARHGESCSTRDLAAGRRRSTSATGSASSTATARAELHRRRHRGRAARSTPDARSARLLPRRRRRAPLRHRRPRRSDRARARTPGADAHDVAQRVTQRSTSRVCGC